MLSYKYLDILLFVLIILPYSELYSENCGTVTNCPDKPYKYWFCNNANNQMVELCEKNPNNVPGFTPIKAPAVPLCFEFESTSSDPTQQVKLPLQVGGDVLVFDLSKVQDDIDNAQYDWNCLCGKQNDECVCTIKVRFVKDKQDWPFNNRRSPLGSTVNTSIGAQTCVINCTTASVILLNNLPEFNKTMLGYRLTSLSNEEYSDNLPDIQQAYISYNLTDIMFYGIGHQYGLQSQRTSPMCNPPYDGGIMGSAYTFRRSSKGLSRDDKCMFKKLYCPSLTPVEDEYVEETGNVENFPNPFDNKTYFSFSVPEEGCYVIITVYNQVGNVVAVPLSKQYNNPGQQNEMFDASELPSGFYYYTIRLGREIKTNKMIVSR